MSAWKTSSFCGNSSCVEIMFEDGWVYVRDSTSAVLKFSRDEWLAFIAGARLGEFNLPEVRR